MGPRSGDRGNLDAGVLWGLRDRELQWGRDQVIAEMGRLSRSRSGRPKLQWGRDQVIAEILQDLRRASIGLLLQWGRDQVIAEIPMCWR